MDYEEKICEKKIFFYEKEPVCYLFEGNAFVWFYKETFKWFTNLIDGTECYFLKIFYYGNVKHKKRGEWIACAYS